MICETDTAAYSTQLNELAKTSMDLANRIGCAIRALDRFFDRAQIVTYVSLAGHSEHHCFRHSAEPA